MRSELHAASARRRHEPAVLLGGNCNLPPLMVAVSSSTLAPSKWKTSATPKGQNCFSGTTSENSKLSTTYSTRRWLSDHLHHLSTGGSFPSTTGLTMATTSFTSMGTFP